MKKDEQSNGFESRLRELEAEALRLSQLQLAPEYVVAEKTYSDRLDMLENSHSHSWFGDHASTYFDGFRPPPPGQSFDVEWGFVPGFHGSHNPGWRIYSREEITKFVFAEIGEDIFHEIVRSENYLSTQVSILREQSLDVLEAMSERSGSKSLERYARKVEGEFQAYDVGTYVNARLKNTPRMTRDSEEIAKGQIVPAHVQYSAPLRSLSTNKIRASELAATLRNAIQAAALQWPSAEKSCRPRKVFFGHGRSEQWRILKDFVRDRLGLDHEEFNRVSPAGISTQERLTEMLNHCEFAFLIMTAEDIHDDGSKHARENVIHEVGLFQGRLGWRRAIIILEEGCDEFSNVVGLGQIRYTKGQIRTCLEEVRQVLEREGLVK